MGLNCKPGDLAVNVDGLPEYRGEIYTVVREYDGPQIYEDLPAWWIDHRGGLFHCLDSVLRPIRDQDGTDEMIRIAGLPNKEFA